MSWPTELKATELKATELPASCLAQLYRYAADRGMSTDDMGIGEISLHYNHRKITYRDHLAATILKGLRSMAIYHWLDMARERKLQLHRALGVSNRMKNVKLSQVAVTI